MAENGEDDDATETEDEEPEQPHNNATNQKEHDSSGDEEPAELAPQPQRTRRAHAHVEFPGGLEQLHGSNNRRPRKRNDDRKEREKRLDAERQRAVRARLLQEASPEEKPSQQQQHKTKRRRHPGPPAPGDVRIVKRASGSSLVLGAGSLLYFDKLPEPAATTPKDEQSDEQAMHTPPSTASGAMNANADTVGGAKDGRSESDSTKQGASRRGRAKRGRGARVTR
jgi:hypothetical protein